MTALVLAVAGLVFGPTGLTLTQLWGALVGGADPAAEAILIHIRIPRVALGMAVGAGLALSGTSLQGLLRNPLADPGLIGVTGGAALGAVGVIVLGGQMQAALPAELRPYLLQVVAFLGAMAVTVIVFRLARQDASTSVATLILAGVAINAITVAGIGSLIYMSDDQQLRELSFWTLGGLGSADWTASPVAITCIALAAAGLLRLGRPLDLLQMGERSAFHAGLNVESTKFIVGGWSALAVGAGTAIAGPISFVGLVAPHLARLMLGPAHRFVLPASACLGAALLLAADLAVRTVVPPAEPPIGLATGLIGGPFFLWLLVRRRALDGRDA